MITDEADGGQYEACDADPEPASSGNPESWFQAVVEAKLGFPQNAAVVLLHHILGECGPKSLDPIYEGCNLLAFADRFGDNGFKGCIGGDYGELFAAATETVSVACAEFVAPG